MCEVGSRMCELDPFTTRHPSIYGGIMPNPLVAFVLSLLVQLATAAPGPGRVTWGELRSARGADSPAGAIHEYTRAYSERSVERLGALLAADFRSHIAGQDAVERCFPEGIDRATEMSVIRGLIRGVRQGDSLLVPPARDVRVKAEGLTEADDPEHPDSTEHYRIVVIERFKFDIVAEGESEFQNNPSLHIVHLVRGDAARLVPGQPADARHWYIRRWLEDVNGLATALGKVEGDCEQADSAVASRTLATLALSIHPLGNPACPTLDIACDLPAAGPARIEVFDVMGRRLQRKDFDVAGPGTMKLQAGSGVRLAPGAYWVRLSQASRRSTRMVVVAR
jgi:hypothetical protein